MTVDAAYVNKDMLSSQWKREESSVMVEVYYFSRILKERWEVWGGVI